MKYDMTAIEIMKRLGFTEPAGQELLEETEKALRKPMPKVYREFMEIAASCPVLETGDFWCGGEILRWLEEQDGEPEYLEIGSDYSAGIVTFGLRMADMDQNDPPVYLQHEGNPPEVWEPAYQSLSAFLLDVVLTALTMVMYETAEEALEEYGWTYSDYFMECMEAMDEEAEDESGSEVTEETLRKKGIDPEKVQWHECSYGGKVFCCYDEAADALYTGCWDGNEENTLFTISRSEE